MPIFAAIAAWLVSFWTTLSAALVAVITTRFAVAAFVGALFIAAWAVLATVIRDQILNLAVLLDVPTELVSWLAYMNPPALSVCISALLLAYVAQVVFRLLTAILSIKSGG